MREAPKRANLTTGRLALIAQALDLLAAETENLDPAIRTELEACRAWVNQQREKRNK